MAGVDTDGLQGRDASGQGRIGRSGEERTAALGTEREGLAGWDRLGMDGCDRNGRRRVDADGGDRQGWDRQDRIGWIGSLGPEPNGRAGVDRRLWTRMERRERQAWIGWAWTVGNRTDGKGRSGKPWNEAGRNGVTRQGLERLDRQDWSGAEAQGRAGNGRGRIGVDWASR